MHLVSSKVTASSHKQTVLVNQIVQGFSYPKGIYPVLPGFVITYGLVLSEPFSSIAQLERIFKIFSPYVTKLRS